MFLTDTFQAVWSDDESKRSFSVEIARLDKPEARAYWESLSEAEQEVIDDVIFYFVYAESEWESLYDPNGGNDFYLLKDE